MSNFRSQLHKKARRTIVQYAIFRWESAVVVAGTIVLTALFPKPFPWWPIWGWPLLGLIALVAIILSSVTNVEANAALLLRMSQAQFDLTTIQEPELRRKVELALEYQRRITGQVRRKEESVLWERPEDTSTQLDDWIANVYRLAKRLDAYQRDALLATQREKVPEELKGLSTRRKEEDNPIFQRQLDELLESKRKQLEAMEALDTRMKQAELQLAQTLTAMATVDSQVKLIDAQDVESGRSERLRADIQEQIARLNDLIGSINEVYDYHKPGIR